jgi:hypothetical protein
LLLIPAIYLYNKIPSEPLFDYSLTIKIFLYFIEVLIIIYTIYASKSYDNDYFLGIKQIKKFLYNGEETLYEKNELSYDGALKYVRHPYYFAGIVFVWCRPLYTKDLVVNIIFTIYFIIGAINEERKLLKEFGDDYIEYRKKVPMIIPAFWRLFWK